jgi:pimeloyl-ACP methyl ester carboxylesterase
MSEIAVTREGRGPELLLMHGGASASATWHALAPLSTRWTLVLVHRRGYPPSPPGDHDFELDADDLAPLLESRPHVMAHSYGALGALIAATRHPEKVRSLTVIEPPLFSVARGDAEVQRFERMSNEVLSEGLGAKPETLRAFLRIAGAPGVRDDEPLSPKLAYTIRRAHGGALPGGARPDLETLRAAKVPGLVASGGHSVPIERICDALASELGAKRIVVAGAGHFVQNAAEFARHLTDHLAGAD